MHRPDDEQEREVDQRDPRRAIASATRRQLDAAQQRRGLGDVALPASRPAGPTTPTKRSNSGRVTPAALPAGDPLELGAERGPAPVRKRRGRRRWRRRSGTNSGRQTGSPCRSVATTRSKIDDFPAISGPTSHPGSLSARRPSRGRPAVGCACAGCRIVIAAALPPGATTPAASSRSTRAPPPGRRSGCRRVALRRCGRDIPSCAGGLPKHRRNAARRAITCVKPPVTFALQRGALPGVAAQSRLSVLDHDPRGLPPANEARVGELVQDPREVLVGVGLSRDATTPSTWAASLRVRCRSVRGSGVPAAADSPITRCVHRLQARTPRHH